MNETEFENITIDNITKDEKSLNSPLPQESLQSGGSLSAGYYDSYYYYERFLDNQNTMIQNQNTIIGQNSQIQENQGVTHAILNTHTTYFEVLIFFIGIVLITSVVRNMLKRV